MPVQRTPSSERHGWAEAGDAREWLAESYVRAREGEDRARLQREHLQPRRLDVAEHQLPAELERGEVLEPREECEELDDELYDRAA